MEDSAAPYLTIRDLKIRSEQQRSQATASLERPAAPDMSGRFASLLFGRDKSEDAVPASTEAPNTRTETPSLPASQPEIGNPASVENENAVAFSSASPDAPSASTEPPHSPASPTVNEDTVEQREREALLFQSNQRRRRRARQGY
jgi:hypothetical protein